MICHTTSSKRRDRREPAYNLALFATVTCAYHADVRTKCHKIAKLFSWNDLETVSIPKGSASYSTPTG